MVPHFVKIFEIFTALGAALLGVILLVMPGGERPPENEQR
jgi:hypothetical protein